MKVKKNSKPKYTIECSKKELDIIASLVGQCSGDPVQVQRIYDALDAVGANGFRYFVKDADGEEVGTLNLEERFS